jgi:hypothetical protein
MPLGRYRCNSCEFTFDQMVFAGTAPVCPACGCPDARPAPKPEKKKPEKKKK